MMLRVKGDPNTFEQYTQTHADLMRQIADVGRKAGATRHAFAAGDGEVIVIDEWPDEASFQSFFDTEPDIPKIMAEGGAQGAPQISFYRKLETPDEF
jgi:hypothetical protein